MPFWDHLDVLRGVILRCLVAVIAVSLLAFSFKKQLFGLILAPQESDFVLYRFLNALAERWNLPSMHIPEIHVQLISTQLTAQFFVHMKAAGLVALVITAPYLLWELLRFVLPALYENEKRHSIRLAVWGILLFYLGVVADYFILFPVSFRFLATYQVSELVTNTITISSYMSTLSMMSLLMGLLFELPVVCGLCARLGFLQASFMRKNRSYALIIIMIVAAVITPTGDAFTLCVVALPVYLLYEVSILLVARIERTLAGK